MHKPTNISGSHARIGWLLTATGLLVLLLLLTPTLALADQEPPQASEPEKCALCHQEETQQWLGSPHANASTPLDHEALAKCRGADAEDCTCLSCHTTNFDPASAVTQGVTCEACHGPYVEGHPGSGVMQLDVDSSVCSTCHVETHKAWQDTPHAKAGVQCIGCHRSHTQDLRLDDEVLCRSCHSDRLQDPGHEAHNLAGVNCIDCHTSPASVMVGTEPGMSSARVPDHRFEVATEVCTGCHGQVFHEPQGGTAHLAAPRNCPEDVLNEVANAEETKQSAFKLTALSLGLGLGIGGILGIVFTVVVGYVLQGRKAS